MNKKFILIILCAFTIIFSSCTNAETHIMEFTNSSDLTVTNITVYCFLGTNSKSMGYNALSNGDTVAPNESVTFTIPPLADNSYLDFNINVTDGNTDYDTDTSIDNVTKDFTLSFIELDTNNEGIQEFTLSSGAEFYDFD